jgi:lipopolysaccharide transport system ATP-binding protein
MYVRLAFGVAAHLETEILLVDEVLAVGDAAFQQRCLGKMHEAATGGRTVLFVSHNMPAVTNICNRAVLLSDGRIDSDGDAEEVVGAYLREIGGRAPDCLRDRRDRKGSGPLRFKSFHLCDDDLKPVTYARSGRAAVLAFEYESERELSQVHISVGIHGRYDERLFLLGTDTAEQDFAALPSRGEVLCTVPMMPLQPGSYLFNLYCTVGGDISDWIQHAGKIDVESDDFFGSGRLPPLQQGPFLVDHNWSFRDS